MDTFFLFLLVGVQAQAFDGALGKANGVISSSVLLALGVPPATASASVHAAEVFTTAASAGSHAVNKNVDWRLFGPLALGGVAGGIAGAFLLTSIDGNIIKPWITAYLGFMGLMILWRAVRGVRPRKFPVKYTPPLGLVGGFFDAVGGRGWGPTVTTTMVGAGSEPRKSIGTTNAAEFFVTSAISATFLAALLTGHWETTDGLADHAMAIGGLILGGLLAAPLAGYVVRIAPVRVLTFAVGILVTLVAAYQTARLMGWL